MRRGLLVTGFYVALRGSGSSLRASLDMRRKLSSSDSWEGGVPHLPAESRGHASERGEETSPSTSADEEEDEGASTGARQGPKRRTGVAKEQALSVGLPRPESEPEPQRSKGYHQWRRFKFDLGPTRLHYVDSTAGIDFSGRVLERSVLLGVDTETRPSFARGEWHPTSLLQVASRDAEGEENVFLFDLLALQRKLVLPDALSDALCPSFGSPLVPKLGVSVGGDLDELAFAYPDMRFLRGVPGVLPLMKLHNLHTKDPSQNEIGLDGFTKIYLGMTLGKGSQRSAWGRRPLSQEQVHYAACDALVAIRIYDALMEKLGPVDVTRCLHNWTPKAISEESFADQTGRKAQKMLRRIREREKFTRGSRQGTPGHGKDGSRRKRRKR